MLLSLLILIIGFLKKNSPNTVDINIHDTYLVIENIYITCSISIYFFLVGIGYWFVEKLLQKKLVNYLTVIHCVILFGSFIAYWIIIFYSRIIQKEPFPFFDESQLIDQTLIILFRLIIFVAQPIYFLNLLIGILKKK